MNDPASRAQQHILLLAILIAAVLVMAIFVASQWYPTLMSMNSGLWISFSAMAGAAILLAVLRLRNPRR